MGRSQRHMLVVQNSTSAGEVHAQGEIAPGVVIQAGGGPILPPPEEDVESRAEASQRSVEDITVPGGPPGGPLQGSSMMGALPESLKPPPEPPEPGEIPPNIAGINPTTAKIQSGDVTLAIVGTGFTAESILVWNGADDTCTFVSDKKLTTIVKTDLATVPSTCTVAVRNGDLLSNQLNFLLIENDEVRALSQVEERSAPVESYTIRAIDDHADGIAIMLNTPQDFQEGTLGVGKGDRVRVEATGNTSVNGEYTVLVQDGTTIIVDNNYELLAPIVNKGRVSIVEPS